MLEILNREFIYFWYYFSVQLEQIFFYWVFGIITGSVISVFCKQKIQTLFENLQSKRIGILGLIPVSLIGIASPLCMYGTIPIAASFSEKGMRDDWLATFMMSSILLNPQLLIYSAALGSKVLIIRFVSCFLCGIAAGLCIRFFYRKKNFFDFSRFGESCSRDIDPNIILRLLKNIWRNIKATGIFFLVGIILSALFQRYVPPGFIVKFFGSNRAFGILMAASIGVPLYVCGGGTIPLLATWLQNGMSIGSATAFMITGPAAKITNLGAVKIILGIKHFILYLLFAIIFAMTTGLLIDLFL
ncbi:MAG: permease [Spirochaetaceae bacterium]|nr:permease [Spirochaetaceae bacterium]